MVWQRIKQAHYDWGDPDTGVDIEALSHPKAWVGISLLPIFATLGTWIMADTIRPILFYIPVFIFNISQSWALIAGKLPRWSWPLWDSATTLSVVGYVSFVAADLWAMDTEGALVWGGVAAVCGLTIAFAYGMIQRSHWTTPTLPLSAMLGLAVPGFFYNIPGYLLWPYVCVGSIVHLIIGAIAHGTIEKRRRDNLTKRRADTEQRQLHALQAEQTLVIATALRTAMTTTQALMHAQSTVHLMNRGFEGFFANFDTSPGLEEMIFRRLSIMQRAQKTFDEICSDHAVLLEKIDLSQIAPRVVEKCELAWPHLSFRAQIEDADDLVTDFIGGEGHLIYCIVRLVRSAVHAGATQFVIKARKFAYTFNVIQIFDNGPGIDHEVIDSLQNDEGRKHVTLWTVARLVQASGAQISFEPTEFGTGTRTTIQILRRPIASVKAQILDEFEMDDGIWLENEAHEDPKIH